MKKNEHKLKMADIKLGGERKARAELLESIDIDEFFVDGNITIDGRTCKGVECHLCIKSCPTGALFWKAGEVGIVKELCVYCGACVLSCIVDGCIRIKRRRPSGEEECFSTPQEYLALQNRIGTEKRSARTEEVFPQPKDYLKRHKPNSK